MRRLMLARRGKPSLGGNYRPRGLKSTGTTSCGHEQARSHRPAQHPQPHTRRARGRAVAEFLAWCDETGRPAGRGRPAVSVRGPSHVVKAGTTLALAPDEARAGLVDDPRGVLFRTIGRGTGLAARTSPAQANVDAEQACGRQRNTPIAVKARAPSGPPLIAASPLLSCVGPSSGTRHGLTRVLRIGPVSNHARSLRPPLSPPANRLLRTRLRRGSFLHWRQLCRRRPLPHC